MRLVQMLAVVAAALVDGLILENSAQPINFDGSVLPW